MAGNSEFLVAVRELSDRIVAAQRPIRVLDAIKWNEEIKKRTLRNELPELPEVDAAYYRDRCPLGYEPADKRAEFHAIERDITRKLGQLSPLAGLMRRHCREYQMVVRMMEARGTPEFSQLSQELYGAASDVFHAGDPTVAQLGEMIKATLAGLRDSPLLEEAPKTIQAPEAVDFLNRKMQDAFPGAGIRVMISDGIIADAAAGNDYIKIREDAIFSQPDLLVLEAHEGWVHLGTSLNGQAQPYCTFLAKGPPSSTITQEGLAVLTEIISMRSTPQRLRKLVNRVRAVTLAEEGADFLQVFRYLEEQGLSRAECYTLASRVFRGSTPTSGPFTKDITYLKGFVMAFNFLRMAVHKGNLEPIHLLFCGKAVIEDLKVLSDLVCEGAIVKPVHIPPPFADLSGLAAYLSFNRFMSKLSFEQLESDYAGIL